LEGPPGVGKTTAAHALANDFGWNVVELNASDARNQTAIEQVAGRAALSHSLGTTDEFRSYAKRQKTLIILDEADTLAGRPQEVGSAKAAPISFRDFLRTRYQSLPTLAQAWGLGLPGTPPAFQRWEQIPLSGGRGAWTRLSGAQQDLNDWRSSRNPPDFTDRGGLAAIARLLPQSRQPIVLTVNDSAPYTQRGIELRSVLERIAFHSVSEAGIRSLLRSAIEREGLEVTREALEAIVHRSKGDVRGALNDLDAIAPLPLGPLQSAVLGGRDRVSDFFAVTEDVFTRPRFYRSVEIRDRLDATPDDLLPWIEENLPRVTMKPGQLVAGMSVVARAERFLALARRARVWALWSFASELMTGGAGLAVQTPQSESQHVNLSFPQFLGAMGRSRWSRQLRKGITAKIGRQLHVSRAKGGEQFLAMVEELLQMVPNTPERNRVRGIQRDIVQMFEFNREEAAFLTQLDPNSPAMREMFDVKPLIEASSAGAEPAQDSGRKTRKKQSASPKTGRSTTPSAPPPAAPTKVQRRLGEY
jgi:DNA polymerase III delta prime subunit